MLVFPNAKINIGLNITEKRTDGFHNIESVFYPIGWKDALEVIPSDKLDFQSTGLAIPGNADSNLIIKAFHLIKSLLNADQFAKIHLHKIIPMGAGLGGGSADGAFALKLFNETFQLSLSDNKLEEMAAELGSDCPFFIENKPVFCYDRGIKFQEIDLDLSSFFICLVNPEIHISTAEAYASISPQSPELSLKKLIKLPINEWQNQIVNDFEKPLSLKYPVLKEIKENLYNSGAIYASMTGSGSTVYGIFEKETHLKNLFPDYIVWEGKL